MPLTPGASKVRSPRFRRKLRTTMSGSLNGFALVGLFTNFKHLLVERLFGRRKMPRSKKKRQGRESKKLFAVQDRIPTRHSGGRSDPSGRTRSLIGPAVGSRVCHWGIAKQGNRADCGLSSYSIAASAKARGTDRSFILNDTSPYWQRGIFQHPTTSFC